MTACLGLGF